MRVVAQWRETLPGTEMVENTVLIAYGDVYGMSLPCICSIVEHFELTNRRTPQHALATVWRKWYYFPIQGSSKH